jgi:hypothetical protein
LTTLAKGRVERSFDTAQDRLVKGLRVAGAKTLEAANEYLEKEFLPWWNQTLVVEPASAEDAHRGLERRYNLAAILCHVEMRQVKNDYTVQFQRRRYAISSASIMTGMRGGTVRVEKRLDGTVALRFRDRYLKVKPCVVAPKAADQQRSKRQAVEPKETRPRPKSRWMEDFLKKPGPSMDRAIRIANATS